MLFNSIEFILFFPTVVSLYFLLPHKYRWGLLLSASCIFYMAFIPIYILILFLTILVDYWAAIYIERSHGRIKDIYLIISIISTCMILFAFKYFNFFNSNFVAIASFFHLHYPIPALQIILPIGLSFHTFQSLSYVIEVYKGNFKPETNFGIYALYVMFFPQLVAGPIERPQNLLHQFYDEHRFEYLRVTNGLKLIVWGIFKKVVIADRLAALVNHIYQQPTGYTGMPLVIATIFFAYQIYCDFSGYSDIAIGSAQVLGFKLMQNFNRPYFSKSIAEFWKRWHISLSTWFRDYLYIPLGGNRVSAFRWKVNIFITFLVSGLWHGANWTYVIWGGLNGMYIILSNVLAPIRNKLEVFLGLHDHRHFHNVIKILITFSLTCFAWVFFRANNLREALYIIGHSITGLFNIATHILLFKFSTLPQLFSSGGHGYGIGPVDGLIAIGAIIFLESVHMLQRKYSIRELVAKQPVLIRWCIYIVIVLIILNLGYTEHVPFIYFQF